MNVAAAILLLMVFLTLPGCIPFFPLFGKNEETPGQTNVDIKEHKQRSQLGVTANKQKQKTTHQTSAQLLLQNCPKPFPSHHNVEFLHWKSATSCPTSWCVFLQRLITTNLGGRGALPTKEKCKCEVS